MSPLLKKKSFEDRESTLFSRIKAFASNMEEEALAHFQLAVKEESAVVLQRTDVASFPVAFYITPAFSVSSSLLCRL